MTATASKTNPADALRILEDAYAYYPGNALGQRKTADIQAAPLAELKRYA